MPPFSPGDVTFIVDTREQRPWDLEAYGVNFVNEGLKTGDYSLKGFQNSLTVERKSLEDIVQCCGKGRERFERELDRMQNFVAKVVIIESPWSSLERGNWISKISPKAVTGSIIGWMQWGIPFFFAKNESDAAAWAVRYMLMFAKRRKRNGIHINGA